MNRRLFTSIILLAAIFFTAFAAPRRAEAGGIGRAKLEALLGVKFAEGGADPKVGDRLTATVLNPEKLDAHGFVGVAKGAKLEVRFVSEKDGTKVLHVEHLVSKQLKGFTLDGAGNLKKLPDGHVR